jgi:hypothetical protein
MVLVRVRLVLGPLGPAPREAATLTCARPRAKRILKVSCQVLENFAELQ